VLQVEGANSFQQFPTPVSRNGGDVYGGWAVDGLVPRERLIEFQLEVEAGQGKVGIVGFEVTADSGRIRLGVAPFPESHLVRSH
jgi:hypothetical protein